MDQYLSFVQENRETVATLTILMVVGIALLLLVIKQKTKQKEEESTCQVLRNRYRS